MPDKKLTDNEIVKALECCAITAKCRQECIFHKYGEEYDVQNCTTHLAQATLELVNRLQAEKQYLEIELQAMRGAANSYKAEVERLKANNKTLENVVKNTFIKKAGFDIDPLVEIKAEAIKEFAERLKDKHRRITDYDEAGFGAQIFIFEERVIDNLLKEIIGE